MRVMDAVRFQALPRRERRRWDRRLLWQWGVRVDEVVTFDYTGPWVWAIGEYELDEAGNPIVRNNVAVVRQSKRLLGLFPRSVPYRPKHLRTPSDVWRAKA